MQKSILFLIKLPPPTTGVTIMNRQVIESLVLRENYEVLFLKTNFSNSISRLTILSLQKIFFVIRTCFNLVLHLLKYKPQLIYFQITPVGSAFYRDLLYVFISKIFRSKILFHLHGKGIAQKARQSIIRRTLYRFVFHNAEVICLSQLLTFDIKDVSKATPFIVNNGLPTKNISVNASTKHDKITILFLSNLFEFKGILNFIQAISIVRRDYSDFEVFVIGEEGDVSASQLNELLTKYNLLTQIKYLGSRYGVEKEYYLSMADILVYPTHEDAFPLVLLEAMQFETAIVATRIGAISEIVDDGITGILINHNTPEHIANSIKILLADSILRLRLSKAGKEKFFNKYTSDIFEKNISKVFTTVLNG